MSKFCEDEESASHSKNYPSIFPVSVTHLEFPSNYKLFEQSGLPYGAIITPFIGRDDLPLPHTVTLAGNASHISRCERCMAYINPFVNINASATRWICSLCYAQNDLPRASNSRYRQQLPIKSLEEQQCLLSDFPVPFRAIDGVLESCEGKSDVPANQRPLVHVFLVQESMPVDALQAVLEAIEYVVSQCMHPDVQVVLLSFSNRIGLYNLRGGEPHSVSAQDAFSAHFTKSNSLQTHVPTSVQYVNLSQNNGSSTTPLFGSSPQSLNLTSQNSSGLGAALRGADGSAEVGAMKPLAAVSRFLDIAAPVEQAQQHIEEAVDHLYDGWRANVKVTPKASVRTFTTGVNPPEFVGVSGTAGDDDATLSSIPETAIGPVIEEIANWICARPRDHPRAGLPSQNHDDTVFSLNADDLRADIAAEEAAAKRETSFLSDNENENEEEESAASTGGLFGLLADIGAGLLSQMPINALPYVAAGLRSTAESAGKSGERSSQPQNDQEFSEVPCIDSCSGVVLHLFVSNEQDLPQGWHASAAEKPSFPGMEPFSANSGVKMEWALSMGEFFAQKQLSVNLWGVTSFEENQAGLHCLSPLAQLTGGSINHIALGAYPRDARAHLKESLRQACAARVLATRCVLKLRTSPCLSVIENSFSGHAIDDAEFPGVFRMAQCTPSTSIGIQFNYHMGSNIEENNKSVVLQMAFAYDTLVEGHETVGSESPPLSFAQNTKDAGYNEEASYMESVYNIWGLNGDNQDVRVSLDKAKELRVEARSQAKASRYQHNKRFLHDKSNIAATRSSNMRDKTKITRNALSEERPKDLQPEMCCYDRSRRLVSVRRLRVFTCSLQCTSQPRNLLKCIDTTTMASLIVRQAIKDEIMFRRQQHVDGDDIANVKSNEIDNPGVELLDGWAATLIASTASVIAIADTSEESIKNAVNSALEAPIVTRMLQLLYGARVALLSSRIKAHSLGLSRGMAGSNSSVVNRILLGRVVTDEFTELSSLLLNLEVRTTRRILCPLILPLQAAALCEPGNENNVKELEKKESVCLEWFVGAHAVQLSRDALVMDGSPAYLIDAGNSLALYRASIGAISCSGAVFSGDPDIFDVSLNNYKGPETVLSTPSIVDQATIQDSQKSLPTASKTMQSPEKVGRFQALNILGRLDQFAGRLAGEPQDEATPEKAAAPRRREDAREDAPPANPEMSGQFPKDEQKDSENKAHLQLSHRVLDEAALDSFVRRLYRSSAWLHMDVQNRLDSSPIVPRIMAAEAGTSSAAILTRALLMDIPDSYIGGTLQSKGVAITEQSYATFVENASRIALAEVSSFRN